jgi:hypothetical protein
MDDEHVKDRLIVCVGFGVRMQAHFVLPDMQALIKTIKKLDTCISPNSVLVPK